MKKKILVVDDEPDMVELLKLRLEAEGFEVLTAYDGMEGIAEARDNRPDLIILDIMMPRMSGYLVCELLKTTEGLKAIPVIMLTARDGARDKKIGLHCGAQAYITKPFELNDLLSQIAQLL